MIALILMDPVPMTCYVMQGDHPIPQAVIQKFAESGSELCPNLFLLSVLLQSLRLLRDSTHNKFTGKSGFLTTSHGLRIGCLGGVFDEQVYSNTEAPLVCDIIGCIVNVTNACCASRASPIHISHLKQLTNSSRTSRL